MAIFYHGTSALFDHFDISHLFEGDGKCKFGVGEYATSVYATAALYAGKGKGDINYVYTIEIPEITEVNSILSAKPVNQSIIKRVEEKLGPLPDETKSCGKFFRKYIGNLLIDNKGTVKKMTGSVSLEGEIAVSKFLYSIGVLYLVWPNAQTAPDNGDWNIAILDDNIIKIKKIESVELDAKGKFIPGSNKMIKQYE